jgi:hypothetical protein
VIEARITGLPELKEALLSIPAKLRRRALRNALAAGARVVRDEARRRTPVLKLTTASGADALRRGVRKPGTVRDALSVRTSKNARLEGNVGVFVNVKPAKGGKRGAKSPNDPFYSRWLQWGWNPATRGESKRARRKLNKQGGAKRKPGAQFLEAGAAKLQQALDVFVRKIGPAIQKLDVRPKDPL